MRKPGLMEQMAVMYATEIEQLQAKNERLRATLERIANDRHSDWSDLVDMARSALAESQ